ncbi:MAG: acyltransferase [Cyanobacteria bacterium SZAS TMP-1]|nr:acyltransferase [Cyanobacteria bacterium SZAS TMP-1]
MGTLRLWLALCVLLIHAQTGFYVAPLPGSTAVQMFFIISGFYMSLVWDDKFSKAEHPVKSFYKSRFLRIFPAYWLTILLSTLISLAFFPFGKKLCFAMMMAAGCNPLTQAIFTLANVTLLGQDVLSLFGVDQATGGLVWRDTHITSFLASIYLLVPQGWSLAVEFYFYLSFPFLMRLKKSWFYGLFLALLALELALSSPAIGKSWVHYFLFPFNLHFFMAGMVSYRLGQKLNVSRWPRPLLLAIYIAVAALTLSYQYMPLQVEGRLIAFFTIVTLALPAMFELTRKNKVDRFIGELSYPVYLLNQLAICLVGPFYFPNPADGLKVCVAAILMAVAFYKLFIVRIENYRHKIVAL